MKTIVCQEHQGPLVDRVGDFQVVECESCGFRHVTPIPTEDELREVYSHEYYSTEKPIYLERAREDREWWDLVYRERYELFEELLPEGRRRLLDVGSGPGFFLLHGKERGWRTLGVEPSRQAAEHARGLGVEVIEEFLDGDVAQELGTFDVVHLSEVLEHLPDPAEHLRSFRDLLAPDGLVCVSVPNDYNPFQQALRDACDYEPWWVAPPHHLNYFDFASLRRLLERCGFEVVREEASFPMDLFLLMGDNYVGNDELGRACHLRRAAFEQNLERAGLGEVKRQLYLQLAALGLGRTCVTTARRK